MAPEEVTPIHGETNALVFEGRRVHVKVEELHVDNIPEVARLGNGRPAGKPLLLITRAV
jgi:misacylated tRNA(Ala) deacylase